jgi:AraC family transcriptional regulator, transcriptional activator of pobA
MKSLTLDSKKIDLLRDVPDMIPVLRESFEPWTIRVFNRKQYECRNYLSPNRRDFYKILLISSGTGVFTLGLNTYNVAQPTILFLHPNDIISWKNTSSDPGGYYVLFRKSFISNNPLLKATIDKLQLFSDKKKSVVQLEGHSLETAMSLFGRMQEENAGDGLREAALQAYIQLLMVEALRAAQFPVPENTTDDFHHIHQFFDMLEQETAQVNVNNPIRIKTAKEFAADLAIHPNYLNALLKKHTGQNVSTHIKGRLLEETKVLLLQTDWSLQDISYTMGFSDQPNFNLFFKKNTGQTPSEFRKSYQAVVG